MNKIILSVAAAGLMAAGTATLSAPVMAAESAPAVAAAEADTASKADMTKAALRDLWLNHVFWVRNVALAKVNGDTAAGETAEKQAVANAQAIAAAIEPFYGAEAKDSLFKLLAGH